ncbi:MAG: FG-GAP repeat domain-containing protein [Planctomycetota bacterium]
MRTWTRTTLFAAGCVLAAAPASAQFGFTTTGYPVGPTPDAAAVGDFDNDGDLDLAVTNDAPDKVSILFNGGNGTFSAPVHIFLGAGTSPHTPIAGDLDGDGDVDLAVSLKNANTVQLILNTGGVMAPGGSFRVGAEPRDLAIGDLDRDLDQDLVVSNRSGDSVSVLRNNGGLSFSATTYPAGLDPRDLDLGDVTGDGLLDIVIASHDSDMVTILRNTGAAAFTANPPVSTAPRSPEGVVLARFDGNATLDIAATGSNGGVEFAMVSLNGGGGAFGPVAAFVLSGVDAGSMDAADFDGDGDNDLAIANRSSNNLSLLQNNGAGAFGPNQLFVVGTAPGHVVATHLDLNGVADLVATNETTGGVSVLLNGAGGVSPMLTICHPGDAGFMGCPCANPPSVLGRGCDNSSGTGGALLTATGTASLGADTLVFTTSGQRPTALSIVAQWNGAHAAGVTFGMGVRCTSGTLKRLYSQLASGGSITAPNVGGGDLTVSAQSAAKGDTILAGTSRRYLVYYRDNTPLGGCPAASNFNATQTGRVLWAP